MKISNEVRIAIFAIIALALGFWGFKFLKGINVLTPGRQFFVKYKDVDQLRPNSPVLYNGLQVGMVKDMYVDKTDDKTIIVVLSIDSDMDIPKDSKAAITGLTLMGGKSINLLITSTCEGGNCAASGDYLDGTTSSFIQALLGPPEQVDAYSDRLKKVLGADIDSLARANPDGLGGTIGSVDKSLRELEVAITGFNKFFAKGSAVMLDIGNDTRGITKMLDENDAKIEEALKNLSEFSGKLAKLDLDKSMGGVNTTLDSVKYALSDLRVTLKGTQNSIGKVSDLSDKLIKGEGSLGKLLTDDAFYNNVTRFTRHTYLLEQDLRLHPERYTKVKVKLFGKHRGVDYKKPTYDPAYDAHLDSLERSYNPKK
jgi:phospholipid/cholesterol/gamma-HCH transport system substrate-binding protein